MTRSLGGIVRITGGELRGRKLKTPGEGTHPMGERERIALFNMLAGEIQDKRVADLFCGGGTLGIEALSRGADFTWFVDKSERATTAVRQNLADLGVNEAASGVLRADVAAAVRSATERYDVVIADPPYDKYSEDMLRELPNIVTDGGMVVVSHPGEAPELPEMELLKTRKYAGASISIYRKG